MGFFNLFRKDPIEKQWEQDRRVEYKAALQEARMKEAKTAASQQAKIERENRFKPKPNFAQKAYSGVANVFTAGNAAFGVPADKKPTKKRRKKKTPNIKDFL